MESCAFDVERYMGKWYEIAHSPTLYQRGCANAIAEYSLLEDGSVEIVNTCYAGCGARLSEVIGIGNIVGSGQMKITFPNSSMYRVMSWVKNKCGKSGANYIVLDTDYDNYAIVTSSSRKDVWLLSRVPCIKDLQYYSLLKRVREFGVNTRKITVDKNTVLYNNGPYYSMIRDKCLYGDDSLSGMI